MGGMMKSISVSAKLVTSTVLFFIGSLSGFSFVLNQLATRPPDTEQDSHLCVPVLDLATIDPSARSSLGFVGDCP
jgi:hypothetical protein